MHVWPQASYIHLTALYLFSLQMLIGVEGNYIGIFSPDFMPQIIPPEASSIFKWTRTVFAEINSETTSGPCQRNRTTFSCEIVHEPALPAQEMPQTLVLHLCFNHPRSKCTVFVSSAFSTHLDLRARWVWGDVTRLWSCPLVTSRSASSLSACEFA